MPAIKGSKVRLKQGDGGDPTEAFATVAASRDISYSIEGGDADTTSQDEYHEASGEHWTADIVGTLTMVVNANMLVKDKTSYAGIIADRIAGTVRNYQIEVVGFGSWEGPFRVSAFSGSGQFDQAAPYTMTLRSQGRVTFTTAA